MKMNKQVAKFGVVMGALVAVAGVQQAQAATTADTTVSLVMQDNAAISTTTPTVSVTPSLTNIIAKSVTTTDNPIELIVSSSTGAEVTIAGNGGTLADADLELQANGVWVGADDNTTALYTSTSAQDSTSVPVNIRISNLDTYNVGSFTNTVTFTIVEAN